MKIRKSRLSETKTQSLLEHFVAGTPARMAAELVGVNRNTATRIYRVLRERIAAKLASSSENAILRQDAAALHAAACIVSGERPVCRLLVSGKNVFIHMLSQVAQADERFSRRHNAGPTTGTELALRRSQDQPADSRQFGVIENFWSQSLRYLHRYNGIPRSRIGLFLKECEWRFNYGSPAQLMKTLEEWSSETDMNL